MKQYELAKPIRAELFSMASGVVCLYLLLGIVGLVGCTTVPVDDIRDAVIAKREQRKQEQCDCTPQPHPSIVVIIKEDS